jgi:hypothetical protein
VIDEQAPEEVRPDECRIGQADVLELAGALQ